MRHLRLPLALFVLALAAACPPPHVPAPELSPSARDKVQQANRLASAGKLDASIRLLDSLSREEQRDEGAAAARFRAAETYFSRKAWSPARAQYQRLLAQAPEYRYADAARYHLGICALELGSFQEAQKTLDPLYSRLPTPEKPAAALALSRAAEGQKQYVDAVRWQLEREEIAVDPAVRDDAVRRGAALVESTNLAEATRLASSTSHRSPLWPVIQLHQGKLQRLAGDTRGAERTLEELTEKAPDTPKAAEAHQILDNLGSEPALKPDTIGVILPLSDKYRGYGESVLNGIKLALGTAPIQLVIRDSVGDPEKARQAVAELSLLGVMAIIGPSVPGESQKAAAEAELAGVPIITLTPAEGITKLGPMVFRNMTTWSAQAKALADYATQTRQIKRFAILHPANGYGKGMANLFKTEVLSRGGEVTRQGEYPDTTTTFRPIINQLLTGDAKTDGSKKGLGFEAIFVPDVPKNIGQLAPSLAVADIYTRYSCKPDAKPNSRTALLLGASLWNSPDLIARAHKYVMCSVFVDGFFAQSERPQTKQFTEAYQAAYERAPNLLAASGYDTALILRQILETQQPRTRKQVVEALHSLQGFIGATGPTRFGPDGEVEKPLFFITVDEEGMKELAPPQEM